VFIVAAAFQCIVRALYNLLVVQFTASISFKLSSTEQKMWLLKGQSSGCTKLESLLSRVIGLLTGSTLFHFNLPESQIPAVSFKCCSNAKFKTFEMLYVEIKYLYCNA